MKLTQCIYAALILMRRIVQYDLSCLNLSAMIQLVYFAIVSILSQIKMTNSCCKTVLLMQFEVATTLRTENFFVLRKSVFKHTYHH